MRVESSAGKFILSFEKMEPGDREIVITGKMGLWDAKTHMTHDKSINAIPSEDNRHN